MTRTVTVRAVVNNPDRKLKPAMLASMHIKESPQLRLAVPETAVVREVNQDYLFVAENETRFLRVPVEIRYTIVMDGAFHLDNERKLAELE